MNTERPPSKPPSEGTPRHRRPHPPPALWVRLLLLGVGWFLLLVGVAGLLLPGIQGILTIVLGAAILSIASETVYRLMRRLLRRRWPGLWDRLNGFRDRWRARLARWR
ncbi:MAG: PGPGW domain-containing protein [Thermoanaerobaculia bacterium]